MDEIECQVQFKGKEATLVVRPEDDQLKGFVGKMHVLSLRLSDTDEDELEETFCSPDLEYDEEELAELLAEAEAAAEEEGL